MSTYENCYTILDDIRRSLNEYTAGLLAGTSTSGAFDNDWIARRINRAQRNLHAILFRYLPEEFLTSASLTGVDSVFTLPWDFGAMVGFKNTNNRTVTRTNIHSLPATGSSGSARLYYRKGNTLVLTKSGITDTYTLWYYSKPRDMTQGLCAVSQTLIAPAKVIADYYNGIVLESITGDWVDTITDYTAARVITMATGTLDVSDYYGTVSELPEMFHPLIAARAMLICKAEHPLSQEKPNMIGVQAWSAEVEDAILAFAGNRADVSAEDIWTDYGGIGADGTNIPGQGIVF